MSEYAEWLKEVFAEFGDISIRKMFGGHGVFYEGIMIGLVAWDVLYLKADELNAPDFKALGLKPFMYDKGEKKVQMSYWQAPDETLDDPFAMKEWADSAYQAALRSSTKSKKAGKNKKK